MKHTPNLVGPVPPHLTEREAALWVKWADRDLRAGPNCDEFVEVIRSLSEERQKNETLRDVVYELRDLLDRGGTG